MALGRRLLFVAAAGLAMAGLATAQDDGGETKTLELPSCESKCYNMTAEMKNCEVDDYACTCDGFMVKFYPQYSSCLIEGCAFSGAGISADELESMVCSLAGQSPGTPSSSSATSGTATTTPEPTSDSTGDSPTESTSSSSSSGDDGSAPPSYSSSTSVIYAPSPSAVSSSSGGSSDIPEETNSPTPVDGSGAGRIADSGLYGVFWVGIMVMAAAGLV